MKLFFISDIHGSLFYLKKALKCFEEEKADTIIILGDELYHGPRNPLPLDYNPKEVANILNTYGDRIIAIRGNCDSEVDDMILDYPIMSTYSMLMYAGRQIFITHGHVYNEGNMPKLHKGDIFAYGHTHILKAENNDGIFIFNPGSISLPKEGNLNSYGIIIDDKIIIKDLEGNMLKQISI